MTKESSTMTMPTINFGDVLPEGATHIEVTVVTNSITEPVSSSGASLPTISFGSKVVTEALPTSASRTDLLGGGDEWEQVRDYVVSKIEDRWGAFPRNPITEASIFRAFVKRWGDKAMPIARAACDDYGCIWQSAPISVNRFCQGSDPYFASILAQRITVPA